MRLSEEIDFQNQHKININVYDILGKVLKTQEKILQLSPYYIKDHPHEIKDSSFDCLTTGNLFANKEEMDALNKCMQIAPVQTKAEGLVGKRKLLSGMAQIQPKGSMITQFHFVQEEDKLEFSGSTKKSFFAEKYKEQIK